MDGNFYAQSFPLLSRRNHSRCFRQFHHFLLAYNIHQFIYMLSLSTCNLITMLIHVSSVLTKPFENQIMQFLTLRFVWFVFRKVLSFFSFEQVITSLYFLSLDIPCIRSILIKFCLTFLKIYFHQAEITDKQYDGCLKTDLFYLSSEIGCCYFNNNCKTHFSQNA